MRMHAFGQMSQLVHAPAAAHLRVIRKSFSAFRLSHARFREKPCQKRETRNELMRHETAVKKHVDSPMGMDVFGQMSQLVHASATA